MNWDAIGAVGEVLGAIAVLLTLVYIALQLRQVKKELHITGFREINRFFSDVARSVTTDMAKVLAKVDKGLEIEDWEQILLDQYCSQTMSAIEIAWQHVDTDSIDIVEQEALAIIDFHLQKPGMRSWWESHRGEFLLDWQDMIDGRYSESDGA